MRIGSLFSGAGGLDLAVEAVFGATTAWHCEIDPAASKVLAARWPGVPNLGDITDVDFGSVAVRGADWDGWDFEPIDILCGGYPCQPFSAAGQRKGADDERHLWPYFAEAIRVLRPRYVVLENVAGHRSMGLDQVLADLAGIGYVGSWCSLRASDVGAPHRRERLFVLANSCSASERQPARSSSTEETWTQTGNRLSDSRGERATRNGWPASDSACDGRRERWRGSDAPLSGHGPVDLLPTPVSSDGKRNDCAAKRNCHTPSLASVDYYLPTPAAASDATGGGSHPDSRTGHSRQLIDYALLDGTTQWGKYAAAIHRWEQITRPAPAPTESNKNGNPRLAAPFAEWMMGWPASWVTNPDIGISRNDQLRIIGNGVVPQQATAALQWLLAVSEEAA